MRRCSISPTRSVWTCCTSRGPRSIPSLRPGAVTRAATSTCSCGPRTWRRLDRAMRQRGWRLYSTFEYGSPFGHAQTYFHDAWGYIDIHRFFPGIRLQPERAFDVFWTDRHEDRDRRHRMPGAECARAGRAARAQRRAFDDAYQARCPGGLARSPRGAPRADASRSSSELGAPTSHSPQRNGGLERYRGERDYRLWKVVSEGGDSLGRVVGTPACGPRASAPRRESVARAPLVNVDHLAHRLGRPPTRAEIVGEFFRRPARAFRELWLGLRQRGARAMTRLAAVRVASGSSVTTAPSTRRACPTAPSSCSTGSPGLIWSEACGGDRESIADRVAEATDASRPTRSAPTSRRSWPTWFGAGLLGCGAPGCRHPRRGAVRHSARLGCPEARPHEIEGESGAEENRWHEKQTRAEV